MKPYPLFTLNHFTVPETFSAVTKIREQIRIGISQNSLAKLIKLCCEISTFRTQHLYVW